MQTLGLRPVVRDIVEILGIGADLLEQRPLCFDVGEVLFALIFAAAFLQQAVLAPDAFQRAVADGQIELADQAAGAEGRQSFAQLEQLSFDVARSFVRLLVASPGELAQAGRAVLLVAAQPFANGGHGGGEQPCGGLDAALLGALDQPQAMVVGVFHFTHQIEITSGGGHDAAILLAARGPALPPAGRSSLTASSHSNTSASPRGYDVTGLFQTVIGVASRLNLDHATPLSTRMYCRLPLDLAGDPGGRPGSYYGQAGSNPKVRVADDTPGMCRGGFVKRASRNELK